MITIAYIIDKMGQGGTEKQLELLIKGLDRSRFDPLLICLDRYSATHDIPLTVHNSPRTTHNSRLSCEIIELGVTKLFSLDAIVAFLRCVFILKAHKVAIVQTYFQDSTVFGVLAARAAGVRSVFSCRRDLGFWHTRRELFKTAIANRLTDRVLVNSAAIKTQVCADEKIPAARVSVIYNGIDTIPTHAAIAEWRRVTRKTIGIPHDAVVVGIVANFNRPVKRVDLFVEMAKCLVGSRESGVGSEHPNLNAERRTQNPIHFIIVGSDTQDGKLTALVNEHGLSSVCHLTGAVPDPLPYIAAFDIGVNTSKTEGFSNAIIEYMACCVPVVVTDNPGNRELVTLGNAGFVAKQDDPATVARTIMAMIRDPEKCAKAGRNGRACAEQRFTAARMVQEYEAVY